MQTIHTSFMWLVHIISSRIYVNPYFNLNSHRLAHICVNPSQCMLFIVYGQFTQFSCNSHNSTVVEWHSCRSVRMHITLGSNAHKNLVGWIHIILVAMHTSFQWWNSRRSVRRPGVGRMMAAIMSQFGASHDSHNLVLDFVKTCVHYTQKVNYVNSKLCALQLCELMLNSHKYCVKFMWIKCHVWCDSIA